MTTPQTTAQLKPAKAARIAKRLARAIKLGKEIGKLCERKRLLLERSRADGLPLNVPIALEGGDLYRLQKPVGKFVRFEEIELKEVPKYSRTKKDDSSSVAAASGRRPDEEGGES